MAFENAVEGSQDVTQRLRTFGIVDIIEYGLIIFVDEQDKRPAFLESCIEKIGKHEVCLGCSMKRNLVETSLLLEIDDECAFKFQRSAARTESA